MKHAEIADRLFRWYTSYKRDLPWRKTKDPYRIWVSEIILQQTRIDQGLPYYLRFLDRFPTVKDLAESSIEEVLLVWQGLGYYSRARNMHAAANQVVRDFKGKFPSSYADLIQLKGIGKYTAAAISSITVSEKRAVVDGNVIRLISRLWGITDPVDQAKALAQIEAEATLLIRNQDSGTINQAMMEFGATVCVPRSPNCSECALRDFCDAFKTNKQSEIPFKKGKTAISQRYFNYLYLIDGNRFLIYQRPPNDIWQGLFELPLIEVEKLTSEEIDAFLGFNPTSVLIGEQLKHQLSHQLIHATLWRIGCTAEQLDSLAKSKGFLITDHDGIKKYPVSKLTNNFFLTLIASFF
jgi:A/G-specific adenine glycosylase